MQLLSTLKLLACIAPLHALTPPKSHAAPTPSVRRRTAMRVRGGDNATDALRVRGGTGKKAKKPRKRGGRRWPTYGRSSRDRSRRESRVDTPKAEEPVEDKPIAKDFNQLKEVPQGWIDRTINFLEAPVVFCVEIKFRASHAIDATCFRSCVCAMAWRFHAIDATLSPWPRRLDGNLTHWLVSTQVTELLIGATAVSLSLMEIQRQIIELGTREADYSVLFLAATRMLKAFLAVLRSTRMALRGYKSYAVIKKGENVYLKKIPATDDDAGVV